MKAPGWPEAGHKPRTTGGSTEEAAAKQQINSCWRHKGAEVTGPRRDWGVREGRTTNVTSCGT